MGGIFMAMLHSNLNHFRGGAMPEGNAYQASTVKSAEMESCGVASTGDVTQTFDAIDGGVEMEMGEDREKKPCPNPLPTLENGDSLTAAILSSPETEDDKIVCGITAQEGEQNSAKMEIQGKDAIPTGDFSGERTHVLLDPVRKLSDSRRRGEMAPKMGSRAPNIFLSCGQANRSTGGCKSESDISLEETAMLETACMDRHAASMVATLPTPVPANHQEGKRAYSAELEIGCVIADRFEILSEIASGGYGVVYRARQIGVDRVVALKRLRCQNDPSVVKRFMLEMQIIKDLVHPNTIQLIDAGMDDDHMYIVMEYIEGESLYGALKREKVFSPLRALNITRQVLKSVNEAHQRGILHRDIKPSNILLRRVIGEEDFVKVLDFGIAKSRERAEVQLTQSGFVMGTPHYLAPESLLSGAHYVQSDIFAIGLVFCEMLIGRQVLNGSISQVTAVLSNENPLCIPAPYRGTSLERILLKALAKRPDERYASAEEMIHDLNALEWEMAQNHGKLASRSGGFMHQMRMKIAMAMFIVIVNVALFAFYAQKMGLF